MGASVQTEIMWMRVGAAAACFAAIMGFSRLAYGVLVPPMARALGGTYALYGAIGSANFVGYLLGTLLATRLARRSDRARCNAAALVAMCLAMGACGFAREPIALGILRFLVGVASGCALALTLALAVEGVPAARRGLAAAIVWGGGSLGIALVGVAGIAVPAGLPSAWRIQWFAMAGIGLACALVFTRITTRPSHATPEPVAPARGSLGIFSARRYLWLTLAYFAYGAGYIDIVTFFGAALGHAGALSPGAAWLVLGTAGVFGAAIWGPLVDRMRDGVPVAIASACCGLGALGVATGNATLALAGALAIGVSFIGVPAMVGALLHQRESAANYPRAFASITVVLGVGQIVGPTLGGLVADRFGTSAALAVGAALLGIATIASARYRSDEGCAARSARACSSARVAPQAFSQSSSHLAPLGRHTPSNIPTGA